MIKAYCYGRPGERAFTIRSDGSNLPKAHTWKPYEGLLSIEVGDSRFVDLEADQLDREIFEALRGADGFLVVTAERALRRIHAADLSGSKKE